MTYLLWKALHILSVIAFLGNIATGLFWAAHAHRSRDFRLIAATFDGIIRSDRWFTMPGVFGIIVTGVALAMTAKLSILGTGWILWPIVLFVTSGAVFGIFVAPLQRQVLALARGTAAPAAPAYETLYRKWELWGFVALSTPLLALAIMVLKPDLPAF